MLLKSFGCSFIFGTDLPDDGRDGPFATASNLTWPALLAQKLGHKYRCEAKGGAGNLLILERVLHNISLDAADFYVIGWTWTDRFDLPESDDNIINDYNTITPITNSAQATAYYRYLHSEYRDKITSLIYVKSAIDALMAAGKPFIMTSMDPILLDNKYHTRQTSRWIQEYIRPHLTDFQGNTFLEWSRQKKFPISATLHPLEPAHAAAAELLWPVALDRFSS